MFMYWTGNVCVCVCVCNWNYWNVQDWTGLDWTGLEVCVCVNMQKYLTKQVRLMLAGWRAQVENSQEKKRGRHRSSYKNLLYYVDVSYPPANPDA